MAQATTELGRTRLKTTFGLTGTTCVIGALSIAVLVLQFRVRRYVPGIDWLAVVLISVVGTHLTPAGMRPGGRRGTPAGAGS
jgi:uncharacterized membrane-anchored protein